MKRVVLAEEAESSDVKKLRQTEEPVECKKEKISFTEWSGNIQSTSTSDVVLEEPKSELVSSTPEKSKLGNEDQQNSSATETEDVEKIFEEKIVEGKLGNEDQQNSSETVTEDVEKIFEEKIVEERWQLRPFNVKQRMNHLLSTGNMSDCTFIVGKDNKQEFKAHIVLMSMSSPHFEDLLSESTTVTITDVESDIFKQILEYIYIDYTNLWSLEKTQALYRASTKFQLPHLSGKAVEFLMEKMNLNSIWPIFEAAIDTQDLFLIDECSKFFKKNIAELLKHSKFRKVDPSVLYNLVEDDNLGVMETDLVNGVKQWASQRCTDIDLIPNVENKRAVLGSQVVQNLRFLALKKETFVKQIAFNKQKSDEGILTMDESYAILMNMVVPDSHPMPEGFTDNANPRSTAERLRLNRRIFNPLGTYYKQHHGGSYTNRLTVYANVSGKALTGTKNFTLELTVNRTICLHGIQIPTFYPTDPSSFPKDYEETYVVTIQNSSIPSKPIITSITWSGKVAYNSVMDIMFKDYIKLEKNLKYTILVYTSNTYYVNQKLCTVEEAGQVKFVFKDSVSVFAKSNTLDFGFISQLIYTPLALQ